ncbi:hypothetical protein OXR01_13050 [Staphylococcus gallinarum]|uniref:Phage protein n=1 Tax=Staphylococcus gallinarum TaxID=1293 RepID=A0A0D0RNG1_STAGA|nr:hypothetical protein [Staphylococcus gallinarum]KIR11517.1 hypothetical protein SH09_03885 [Staphylococcus gallinarum]MDN6414817.1 hypothetical protein [Staphylococcus gallinarum]RTX81496.1 hypothetical protein EKQ61_03240 [Staphylococcus gallinarum]SUM33783.1 Uncharacterised protein [Staphylococcus gallinarum]GEQ05529.1 hypothetical protein SGA02_13570 [Staphylococcus gallinarum]
MNKIQSKLLEDGRTFEFENDGEEQALYIPTDNVEIAIIKTKLGYRLSIPSDKPFEPPKHFIYATEDEVLNKLGY